MTIYALKLLFPVLIMFAVFVALARPAFSELLGPDGFMKAVLVLGVCTVMAFLGQDSRIVMGLLAVIGIWSAKLLGGGVRGRLSALLMLVIVMPPAHLDIDGFSDINRFLDLTPIRLLSLLLLPGLAIRSLTSAKAARPRWVTAVDVLFYGYQVLRLALQVPHNTASGMLRLVVMTVLDLILPYYVFSRAIQAREDLRIISTHTVLAMTFAAVIACAEAMVHRNLYEGLQWVYGYKWQLSLALTRGDHLRTQAMTSVPSLLAFELIFALGVWTYLSGAQWKRPRMLLIFALLVAAIGTTWSRGAWLSAIVFGACLYGARRMSPKAFGWTMCVLLTAAVAAKVAGLDALLLSALNSAMGGDAAALSTIDYRRELLDTALALLKQSPWLGVPNYASQMQALKQGEGIIDLVNSYIAIALDAGVIGLFVYLAPYVVAIARLLKDGAADAAAGRPDTSGGIPFGPVFVALATALLLNIFTTSTFGLMPVMLALLLALPIARLRMPTEELPLEPAPRSPIDLGRVSYGVR